MDLLLPRARVLLFHTSRLNFLTGAAIARNLAPLAPAAITTLITDFAYAGLSPEAAHHSHQVC